MSYYIENYPSRTDLSRTDIHRLVAQAFNAWGQYSGLEFNEVFNASADMIINFQSFKHDIDPWAFDGPTGILAHAFAPLNLKKAYTGQTHFDDSEYWARMGRMNRGRYTIRYILYSA